MASFAFKAVIAKFTDNILPFWQHFIMPIDILQYLFREEKFFACLFYFTAYMLILIGM